MNTFDPRDWWRPSGWLESPERDRRRPEEKNREAAQRWLVALAFCVCFASLAPAKLFPLALAGFLFLAGIASIAVACLQRHSPLAPNLTAWDEAAWSFAASFLLQAVYGAPVWP
jgi:hypothetical protein